MTKKLWPKLGNKLVHRLALWSIGWGELIYKCEYTFFIVTSVIGPSHLNVLIDLLLGRVMEIGFCIMIAEE